MCLKGSKEVKCGYSRVNEGAVVGDEIREVIGPRSFRILKAILRTIFTLSEIGSH